MAALPYRRSRIVGILAILLFLAVPVATEYDAKAATDLTLGVDAEVADAQGDAVNLRDQPSYAGQILTSVPEGWLVTVLDGPFADESDGTLWYQVIAHEQTGYMLADYLRTPGDDQVSAAALMTTTANLNLRSGPSLSASVLLVIPNGASVNTTGATQNGYSQLSYGGASGWAASQYLSGGSGSQPATVIDGALNLRSGPGTSFAVLTVMPNGATVTITGSQQNGFYPVSYTGTAGYASATYLRLGGTGPSPTPTVPAGQTATVVDGALNLRSGPGTSFAVITVMPGGAVVTITGSQQNGFYPLSYNGTVGFASAAYLQIGGTAPSPTATTPSTRTAWTIANLNLRTGASTSNTVVLVIPNGSQIAVTGALTNNFYPVRYNGADGFASATFITFTAPGATPTPTVPVGGNVIWPVTGGDWEVLQGYNGSSHQNQSSTWQYLYSLDIARQDGQTAGISAFAPVSGTVRWYERSSGGITIDMGNGYAFAMFHLTVDRDWEPGDAIQQGDFIGTVSPPGGEGFVQVSHIHLTIWQTNDGGNWDRHAVPFSGQFAISGNNLPADGSTYQWSGFEFNP